MATVTMPSQAESLISGVDMRMVIPGQIDLTSPYTGAAQVLTRGKGYFTGETRFRMTDDPHKAQALEAFFAAMEGKQNTTAMPTKREPIGDEFEITSVSAAASQATFGSGPKVTGAIRGNLAEDRKVLLVLAETESIPKPGAITTLVATSLAKGRSEFLRLLVTVGDRYTSANDYELYSSSGGSLSGTTSLNGNTVTRIRWSNANTIKIDVEGALQVFTSKGLYFRHPMSLFVLDQDGEFVEWRNRRFATFSDSVLQWDITTAKAFALGDYMTLDSRLLVVTGQVSNTVMKIKPYLTAIATSEVVTPGTRVTVRMNSSTSPSSVRNPERYGPWTFPWVEEV